ncbi:MAG: OmpH family outer membrane protein [Rikenellaceae bacterium]|nr:OmpH family outer membrane protein [Rikenellaceae bacterium]
MKKIVLLVAALLAVAAVQAQSYIVVNSEKIFKSIGSYNDAIQTINDLTRQYQQNIDAAYANVEKLYADYEDQRDYISQSRQAQYENEIAEREKEIADYQKAVFGPEGELMKKRTELIKPIQDRVFGIINKYAEDNKVGLVLDVATNPSVLYYSPDMDRTQAIIELVKQ